jgi:opacity protein-like surface antigen
MEVTMKQVLVLVLALLVFTTLAVAKSDIGLKGVGGQLGFIMPEDPIDNTIGFGGHAYLGTIIPNLELYVYADYWGKKYAEATDWEAKFSVFGIAGVAKYRFDVKGNIKPYAGGGLALNIGSASADYTGPYKQYYTTSTSSSDTELGLYLIGGASTALSTTLDGFAEIRYNTGGVDYLGIYAGVTYKLGK